MRYFIGRLLLSVDLPDPESGNASVRSLAGPAGRWMAVLAATLLDMAIGGTVSAFGIMHLMSVFDLAVPAFTMAAVLIIMPVAWAIIGFSGMTSFWTGLLGRIALSVPFTAGIYSLLGRSAAGRALDSSTAMVQQASLGGAPIHAGMTGDAWAQPGSPLGWLAVIALAGALLYLAIRLYRLHMASRGVEPSDDHIRRNLSTAKEQGDDVIADELQSRLTSRFWRKTGVILLILFPICMLIGAAIFLIQSLSGDAGPTLLPTPSLPGTPADGLAFPALAGSPPVTIAQSHKKPAAKGSPKAAAARCVPGALKGGNKITKINPILSAAKPRRRTLNGISYTGLPRFARTQSPNKNK